MLSSRCEQPALALQARSYVLRELSEGECRAFEDHLAGCQACSQRVTHLAASLDRLERDAARERGTAGWGWGWMSGWGPQAALAAAVVVLLLGYPAFLGLNRLPRVERDRAELERQAAEARIKFERDMNDLEARTRIEIDEKWRSSVFGALNEIRHLSRSARGGAPADSVTLRAEERLVILGVELEPAGVIDGASYRFAIHRSRGESVWTGDLSGRRVKESIASSGEIFLPVPAESLPAGDYELRVSAHAGAGAEELLIRRLFVVRR